MDCLQFKYEEYIELLFRILSTKNISDCEGEGVIQNQGVVEVEYDLTKEGCQVQVQDHIQELLVSIEHVASLENVACRIAD